MEPVLYLGPIIAFFVTLFATPIMIRYLKRVDLVVKDQNKKDKPLIPLSGGLPVLTGFLAGIMTYIFIQTFYYDKETTPVLFASTITIVLITFIGFLDDFIVYKSKEKSGGLRQWQKPLLTLFTAVPLMVINAGTSVVYIPLLGRVELGLFFPLLIIPLAVVGASNMVNLLEGFNGTGAGMALVYTGMLGLYAYSNQRFAASAIAAVAFTSILAFFYYNKYPAKILPGDSLTYFMGAVLATIAIVGNIEKAALICSIPFIIEFFLKLMSKFKADSFGIYKNGRIFSKYGKQIYSIPHIFTRTGKFTEKQITFYMILIELVFASLIWII